MNDNRSKKVKFGLLQRRGFRAMVSSLPALCLVVGMLIASPVQAEPVPLQPFVVDIALAPCPQVIEAGKAFTLNIYVHPNDQQVDAVDADLTFDPTYLKVLSVTGDPSGLELELPGGFDNTNGTLRHSRGADFTQTPPSTTFRLCSIVFRAEAATPGTTVAFTELTGAYFEGASVLRDTADCEVTVSAPVGGVAYLPNRIQILAPWLGKLGVIAGLILGAVVALRRAHGLN
jgi:hypothetical protein